MAISFGNCEGVMVASDPGKPGSDKTIILVMGHGKDNIFLTEDQIELLIRRTGLIREDLYRAMYSLAGPVQGLSEKLKELIVASKVTYMDEMSLYPPIKPEKNPGRAFMKSKNRRGDRYR